MAEPEHQRLVYRASERATGIARGIAPLLVLVVRVLSIPALLLVLIPAVPLITTWIIAQHVSGTPRIIILVLVGIGAVLTAAFALRVWRYRWAVREREAFVDEVAQLVDLIELNDELAGRLRAVVQRGGIGVLRRLYGVWRVARIPDYLSGRVQDLRRARWFVPPDFMATVAFVTAQLWVCALSWAMLVIVGISRLTGAI